MASVRTGEIAQETGDVYCTTCGAEVHVMQEDTIPECPNGHTEFETRKEPGA